MIIDRFGATYSAAYLFSRHNVVDDYEISRAPVTARVGGMNGAFDFYGSNNYPVQPMIIRKNFSLVGTGAITTGTGTITIHGDEGWTYANGTGTLFLTEVRPGDIITVGGTQIFTVTSIVDNGQLNFTPAATIRQEGVAYTITHSNPSFAGVETAITALHAATITQGESKLWALRRDADERIKSIPIIILSAIHERTKLRFYPDQSDGTYEPGAYLPVEDFVDKPINPADLVGRIERLLGRKSEERI